MTRVWSIIAIVLGALILAGCGSGSGSSSTSSQAQQASTPKPPPAKAPHPGAPKAKESIKQAEARITKLASSADCNTVNELNPISITTLNNDTRCKALERLGTLTPSDAAEYGDGAVISYEVPSGVLHVLLVRDSDGLFHVMYLDSRVPKPSIGTKFASQFDGVASAAVDALRNQDCNAFLKVAFREFGPGALKKSDACKYVQDVPMGDLLKEDSKAKPVLMGGNGTFAFYGLDLPGAFYTLILAKETPADVVPQGVQPLPKDAPTYGFVSAVRTNSAPPSGGG